MNLFFVHCLAQPEINIVFRVNFVHFHVAATFNLTVTVHVAYRICVELAEVCVSAPISWQGKVPVPQRATLWRLVPAQVRMTEN